jgi:hypothetical protein
MSNLEDEAKRLQEMIEELKEKLGELDDTSLAERMSVEQLEADIERLEEAKDRLLSEIKAQEGAGNRVRTFVGRGNRQYLTGMKMDGKRILILVDASASMLGRTYVNAIIYRNMPDEMKLRTPKWRSAIDAVDWITTRMPKESEFQIMAFNTSPWSVISGSGGKWAKVGDGDKLTAAINRLRTTVPESGTSLYNAFDVINKMERKPDNIYLLTDGLPTQGRDAPGSETFVKPNSRLKFFSQAMDRLPGGIPVNILLYPMDGDPDAAGHFWRMAIDTRGSFMTPSQDWP